MYFELCIVSESVLHTLSVLFQVWVRQMHNQWIARRYSGGPARRAQTWAGEQDTAELQDLFAERLSARPDGSSLGQVCWGLTTEALMWSRKTALKGICILIVPAHISTSVG